MIDLIKSMFSKPKTADVKHERISPTIGSKWVPHSDDPFPCKNHMPIVILDVKEGWVRYYINPIFPDERKPIEMFLYCYQPARADLPAAPGL